MVDKKTPIKILPVTNGFIVEPDRGHNALPMPLGYDTKVFESLDTLHEFIDDHFGDYFDDQSPMPQPAIKPAPAYQE